MKVLFDFEDRVNRFWGVPQATINDVYSMLTSDIEIGAWLSDKEIRLIHRLKEFPSSSNSFFDKMNLDISRPNNLNLWLSQFFKVFNSTESDFFYADHFPKTNFRNAKRIIRIHDPFSEFKNPLKEFSSSGNFKLKVARSIRSYAFKLAKSDSIIVCNSRFTANRVSKIYDIPLEKLHVVPNSFNLNLGSNLKSQFTSKQQGNYYLMICGFRGHKRPDIVINCWAQLSKKLPNLVVIGTVPMSVLSDSAKNQIRLGRLVIKSGITEHELNVLKINSNAMIFASEYEGFGRPIIEALIAGVPSIANDLDVFKELDPGCVDFFSLKQLDTLVELLKRYQTKITIKESKFLIKKSKIYSHEAVGKIWKNLLSLKLV